MRGSTAVEGKRESVRERDRDVRKSESERREREQLT
jgi:hypothetical protein